MRSIFEFIYKEKKQARTASAVRSPLWDQNPPLLNTHRRGLQGQHGKGDRRSVHYTLLTEGVWEYKQKTPVKKQSLEGLARWWAIWGTSSHKQRQEGWGPARPREVPWWLGFGETSMKNAQEQNPGKEYMDERKGGKPSDFRIIDHFYHTSLHFYR